MTPKEFRIAFSQAVAEDDEPICTPTHDGNCELTNKGLDNLTNIAEVAAQPLFDRIAELEKPVGLLIFCPNCGEQHVDEAKPDVCETCGNPGPECTCSTFAPWLNPAHKSHRCAFCNHVWRHAKVATNGIAEIDSKGQNDGDPKPITAALLAVLNALFSNPHIDLGDLTYQVRDREGKGWDGEATIAWSEAVVTGKKLLDKAKGAIQ